MDVILLKKCFLFSHLNSKEIQEKIDSEGISLKVFQKNESIVLAQKRIGIIVQGEVLAVQYQSSGKRLILNKLEGGEVFGMINLLTNHEEMLSTLEAVDEVHVLCIPENILFQWLQKDQVLLKAYMKYLHEKIYFLNHRIACFNHHSACDRLKEFMMRERHIGKEMSMTETAEFLGISRSSLYRSLEKIKKPTV